MGRGSEGDRLNAVEDVRGGPGDDVLEGDGQANALDGGGGGDSLAAINKLALGRQIGHLSTGGGASLEFVQGLVLPGVAALEGKMP